MDKGYLVPVALAVFTLWVSGLAHFISLIVNPPAHWYHVKDGDYCMDENVRMREVARLTDAVYSLLRIVGSESDFYLWAKDERLRLMGRMQFTPLEFPRVQLKKDVEEFHKAVVNHIKQHK